MAIVVQTNVPSLIAQNGITAATNTMNEAMERMSTGYKINSAKDDAAGLYVATSLEKNIRGSQVAQQNVQMGNDMLSVAEGDLVSIQENLLRLRDLALTAANGIYDASSLAAIKAEMVEREAEITRIATASQYNGKKLLSGADADLVLQVGPNIEAAADIITISGVIGDTTMGADGLNVTTAETAIDGTIAKSNDYISSIDAALTTVQTKRSAIGAAQGRLESASSTLTTTIENLTSSKSTIMDADIAAESTKYIGAQILQQTAASLLSQANMAPQIALTLI